MLDLQPGVCLDEDERRCGWAAGNINQELKRSEVAVADAGREPDGGVDNLTAEAVIQSRCGGDFDDLLEAALDAALPFAQMRDVARAVAEDLDLDMACPGDEFLNVDLGPSERGTGLRLTALEGWLQLVGGQDGAGAATAATSDGFDDHRASRTEGGEEGAGFVEGDGVIQSANDWHGCRDSRGAGARLVAEQFQMGDVGADKGQASFGAFSREITPFGEEAITRVDGIAPGPLRRRDDRLHVQIRAGADTRQHVGFVGDTQMQTE